MLQEFGCAGRFGKLTELCLGLGDWLVWWLDFGEVGLGEILFSRGSGLVVFTDEGLVLVLEGSEFVGVGGVVFAVVFSIGGVLVEFEVFS